MLTSEGLLQDAARAAGLPLEKEQALVDIPELLTDIMKLETGYGTDNARLHSKMVTLRETVAKLR